MDEDFVLELSAVPEEQVNNFQHLCSRIFSRNEFADCTLCCSDGQLQAHRVILAASSNYMYNMLSTTPWPTPCSHPMLFFKSVLTSDMKLVLEFVYTGKVQVSKGKLSCLMNIARELGSSTLIKAIEKAIQSCGVELFRKRAQTVEQANKSSGIPTKKPFLSTQVSHKTTKSIVIPEDTQEYVPEQSSADQYDGLVFQNEENLTDETFQSEVKVEPEEISDLDPSCLVSTTMTNDDSTGRSISSDAPGSSGEIEKGDSVGQEYDSLEHFMQRGVNMDEDENKGIELVGSEEANMIEMVDEDDDEEEMPIKVVNLKSLAENKLKIDIGGTPSSASEISETLPANCPWCLQVFTSITLLQRHIKTHVGNYKPYTCQYCPSSFARSAHLKRHIRTHTGEKPFICNYCSRAFSRQDKLKTHLEKHLLDQHLQNAANNGTSTTQTLNVPRAPLLVPKPVAASSSGNGVSTPMQKQIVQVSSASTTNLTQPSPFQYFMNDTQETWQQGSPDFQRISQGLFAIPGQMTISSALTPSTTITPISSLVVNSSTSTSSH